MSAVSAHYARRLDLAHEVGFGAGDGPTRRARLAEDAQDFLGRAWRDACASVGIGADSPGVAFALVGSQARADAGPLSDYDLVLLHEGRAVSAKRIGQLAEALWYPMWDSGVRFDHSVRTLAESRKAASSDLAAAVGMLDLAPLAGDGVLVAGVRQAIAADWRGAARKRLPELVESLQVRHQRFGDLTTAQEPDLKEAGGGLRDISLVQALTTAWLADPQRGRLEEARATLLDVRDALHVVTGRGRERMTLQDHDPVAALLGLDSEGMLTRVVDAGRVISYVTDSAVRSAGQSQRARTLRVGARRPTLVPLGHGLNLHDGEVVLGAGRREGGHVTLLRAATAAASRNTRIGPKTMSNLVASLEGLPQPWPSPVREAFVDFLASGPGIASVWESLDLAGVVDMWLPEWAKVRSRPQRNALHQFTVDRHSIETVAQAAALRSGVARPDVLVVAALLHDIGKVAGARDHSIEGAPVARRVVERLGFAAWECDLVERLVREHLTLSELATKRDPDDPRTVQELCDAAGDVGTLDLLEALTEADTKAAGTQAWTPWRAGLVRALAARGRAALAKTSPSEDSRLDTPTPVPQRPEPPEDGEVATARGGDVDVRVEPCSDGGALVRVVAGDRTGLFADIAGVLALRRLSVRAARIETFDGVAVDVWHVHAPLGGLPDADDLTRALRALQRGDRTPVRALDMDARRRDAGSDQAALAALCVPSGDVPGWVLEVRAADRIGLLFDVGAQIARTGARVRAARVETFAGQSRDRFELVDDASAPLGQEGVARVAASIEASLATAGGAPERPPQRSI